MRRALPLLLLALGCGPGPDPHAEPGRGVLVIAIDALRYDHTSFAGYDRDTTPRLNGMFAKQGVVFADAWSAGPSLLPAHIGLLTGCDPTVSRPPSVVLSDGRTQPPLEPWFVPEEVPTLADAFLADGWRTAAFVDSALLEDRRGADRGFRDYQVAGPGNDNEPFLKGAGARFFEWVDDLRHDENWFAYLHFRDLEAMWGARWSREGPHLEERFEPRPELDHVPPVSLRAPTFFALPAHRLQGEGTTLGQYEVDYDTAIAWADLNVRRLLQMLGEEGMLSHTTIVVAGTYGVGFGEAGLMVDSGALSPADLHVPLLLRPGRGVGVRPGQRIEQVVSLLDVAPTLLALHGLPVPAGMHGVNLAPLLRGKGTLEREAVFASHGIVDGFTVITDEAQYAWWEPRSRGGGSVLAQSWYGLSRPPDGQGVRFLTDRDSPARDWLSHVVEAPVGDDLHARGEAWYADLERARPVLHPRSWNADARGEAVVRELRERGLIGAAR